MNQSIIGFLESGRQDSNLRPSAPKAPATQIATAPMRNKWGYNLRVGIKRKFMSLKKWKNIARWCINKQKLAQISLTSNLVPYEH